MGRLPFKAISVQRFRPVWLVMHMNQNHARLKQTTERFEDPLTNLMGINASLNQRNPHVLESFFNRVVPSRTNQNVTVRIGLNRAAVLYCLSFID